MNIAEEIFRAATPDAPAVFEGAREISYACIESKSAALASRLRERADALGIKIPRVGLLGEDSAEYIAAALGILRAGGVFLPVARELTFAERKAVIAATAPHFFLQVHKDGRMQMEESATVKALDHEAAFNALSPAFVRFSSGTTGRAKGVVLSHKTLRERVVAANARMQIKAGDRVLWVLPMAHHFAASIMLYLAHGAAVILPEEPFAKGMLEAGQKLRANVLYAAPYHLEMLIRADIGDLPDLRLAVSTTAPLSKETAFAFHKRFGIAPWQALGIIEVGLPCMNHNGATDFPESVGFCQPGFEASIRDENGQQLEAGREGHLWVRGPGMFDAYLSPWQPREKVLDAEGWFRTGDIAVADASGRITLRGRAQSVIATGGMKFFPEEVEAVLQKHPAIAAVRVSARPHPLFGTVPVAEIQLACGVPAPDTQSLRAWCTERLSRYKIPVAFEVVPSIPLTPSGKIRRV